MKHRLIITEDLVKIQLLTGLIGTVYAKTFFLLERLALKSAVSFLRLFGRVSVLTSDYLIRKSQGVYFYSNELSRLEYADKRLWYWQETNKILDSLKAVEPKFFLQNGIDITQVFATRLCTYLAYEYLVYPQIEERLVKRLQPDKVIYFRPFAWLHRRLRYFLLDREYRLKLKNFLRQKPNQLPPNLARNKAVLLSLDFFRHKKTLEPIFQALTASKFTPVYLTDSVLLAYLPEARWLAAQSGGQVEVMLKDFHHPAKPLIVWSLVLSRLYLKATANLFDQVKPARVVTISDYRYLENSLVLLAKNKQVKSIMISPNTLLDLAEINPYDAADKIGLAGDFIRQKLIAQGVDKEKLTIVGDLQTLNRPKMTKEQVFNSLGIKDRTKKIILLISFRPNWLIPLSEKETFVSWTARAAAKFPEAVLVIKPHPTEKRYRVLRELREWHVGNALVADNRQLELMDLINASAVIVETWSMTIFEAVTLRRPVICVNPFKKNYDFFLPVIKAGGGVEINNERQLKEQLKLFLFEPKKTDEQLSRAESATAHFVRPRDGKEIQRVIKLLE